MSENDVASMNVPATRDEISNMVDLWSVTTALFLQ